MFLPPAGSRTSHFLLQMQVCLPAGTEVGSRVHTGSPFWLARSISVRSPLANFHSSLEGSVAVCMKNLKFVSPF